MLKQSEKLQRVPHDRRKNYDPTFVQLRQRWLSEMSGVEIDHITRYSFRSEDVQGNVENFIGATQVPIGMVGPLLVDGDHAKGTFFIPFALTEGGVVATYSRGAFIITKAGGAKVAIQSDENHLEPVFHVGSLAAAKALLSWVHENFQRIETIVENSTSHGKLLRITPHVIGRRVILEFAYDTADAMGANMINAVTEECCEFIAGETGCGNYLLRSNFSSEKKASSAQLIASCGKSVTAEAVLPRKFIERYLNSTPEKISEGWRSWALASINACMVGINAQFANGLAAIFIACGQDVAHITNGSIGITMFEVTEDGDLYAAVKLPNLLVGTVGGGTALATQRECLQIIGCYGKEKAKKFAEIVAATLLAGELGICAGITSKEFQAPHKLARLHTREKAYHQA